MSAKPTSAFRLDIQGLRALAVVAVILDHLLHWPRGGFVGVDVFFVISGFLITGLLLREHQRTGRISFSAFYRNRVRRILPAAVIVLVVSVGAAYLLYSTERWLGVVSDGGWAALFAANWNFAVVGTDYFGQGAPGSPLQHFWSLAVEEQFYVVWPAVMVVVLALLARYGAARPLVASFALGGVLLAIVVASFAWALWESAASPTFAYFSTFSRAWELGIGALLALAGERLARVARWGAHVLCVAGLAGIVASVAFIGSDLPFPGPWALLPVVSSAAVIASGSGGPLRSAWLLTNPVSRYIGDVSYSLYLWHFPVIIIGASLIGDGLWQAGVLALVFTVLAVYSFHLVEDPIRRSDWLKTRWWSKRVTGGRHPGGHRRSTSRTLVALSFLAVTALATTGLAVAKGGATAEVSASAAQAAGTVGGGSAGGAGVAGEPGEGSTGAAPDAELQALQAELAAALTATSWPALTPSIDDALTGELAADAVVACGVATKIDESRCTWGDPAAPKTVLIAGNSIAVGFVTTYVDALRDHPDWKVISYARIACPFGNPAKNGDAIPDGCAERSDAVVDAVNRLAPDLVAIAGVSDVAGVGTKLSAITADTTIALMTMPIADKPANSCYTRLNSPQDCISTPEAVRGKSIHQRLVNTAPESRLLIDTTNWFCVERRCPPFSGTTLTKSDDRHVTRDYALRLGPVLREALAAAGVLEAAPVAS